MKPCGHLELTTFLYIKAVVSTSILQYSEVLASSYVGCIYQYIMTHFTVSNTILTS